MTLRDVAKLAGVSITTVSRIINNRETGVTVREETRQRILDAAKSLGYRPNLMARGLRGSSSSLIGVIARDISDPFHIQILRGINEVSKAHGHRLFLGHVDYQADEAVAYASMLEQSHADGIILIGDIDGGDSALDLLAEQHRFVVGVTDRTSRRPIPGVYSDSVAGTELALEHLWELGHRSIMCVSDSRTYDGRLRAEHYERYMGARGVAELAQVHFTDQEPEPAYALGQRLIERGLGASAIFATSDTTAIGLMQAAFQAGLAVPKELSIVGYDDIDVARFLVPPLTTVSQTGGDMGRAAGRLLYDMIDRNLRPHEVEDVVLAPALVVRESTSACDQ